MSLLVSVSPLTLPHPLSPTHPPQMLIGFTGSLANSTPYLGGLLGGVILAWIKASQSLAGQFAKKEAEMEKGEWPLAEYEKKEQ
jgi:hypothetical protein